MKLSRSTFALLALNVAWLAVLSYWLARRGATAKTAASVQYVTNYVPVVKPAPVTTVTNLVAVNDFQWAQLESEDYRAYVTRLRAIGCPEQTIRDIVIADIDKLLAPKMQAANPRAHHLKFWQPIEQELWEDAEQKETMQQQRVVDFEKREVIRELLGVDLVGERLRNQGQEDYYGQRLDFLPEEKRARVRLALDQFADRERALLEQQVEETDSVTASDELTTVRAQKETALAQLLTAEERSQYDLWFSDSAARVRDSVYGMSATEEEFLKLYQLHREFTAGTASSDADTKWTEQQNRIRETLGEQRYAEYARAQDPDYRELLRVATRFKLGPEVAAQLYSYKEPVETERARVEANPTFTPQQKTAAYQAIASETQRAFQATLGDKAFRHFIRRSGSPWVHGASGTVPSVASAQP